MNAWLPPGQRYQLEIRPEMRRSREFRLLVEALLSAAREELEWERGATKLSAGKGTLIWFSESAETD
jgi:hypothetical protein